MHSLYDGRKWGHIPFDSKLLFTDILPLAVILSVVAIPFLIERFAFNKRGGLFQWIFWLFAAQCAMMVVGIGAMKVFGSEGFIATIAPIVASLGYITIGVVPFILLPLALISTLIWFGRRLLRKA